jgi:hypothetical protein
MKKYLILLLLLFAYDVSIAQSDTSHGKLVRARNILSDSLKFPQADGHGNYSWQPSSGGGSSAITAITPSLGKLQNTTDAAVIFSFPVPANSWLDGQTILIKELYFYSTSDANDTIGFQSINYTYKIGDSTVSSELSASLDCVFPDTCIDPVSFFARRIGGDIIIFNGNAQKTANDPPGLLFQNGNLNVGNDGNLFGLTTDANKPNYYRIHNVNFTTALNFTFTVNWRAAFLHNYVEARSATVWKY